MSSHIYPHPLNNLLHISIQQLNNKFTYTYVYDLITLSGGFMGSGTAGSIQNEYFQYSAHDCSSQFSLQQYSLLDENNIHPFRRVTTFSAL